MGQPKIVEVDYYILKDKIKRAADAGGRIEKSDKQRWQEYMKQKNVNETSLLAWGKVKFGGGNPRLVVLDYGDSWDGCYVYSEEDEAALRFVPAES
jgi:hypothetical protein